MHQTLLLLFFYSFFSVCYLPDFSCLPLSFSLFLFVPSFPPFFFPLTSSLQLMVKILTLNHFANLPSAMLLFIAKGKLHWKVWSRDFQLFFNFFPHLILPLFLQTVQAVTLFFSHIPLALLDRLILYVLTVQTLIHNFTPLTLSSYFSLLLYYIVIISLSYM